MPSTSAVEKKLDEIIRLLSVIAQPMKREFTEYLTSKFLSTDDRKKMYDLIDGKRTIGEIAKSVKVTHEAVRSFVNELATENLIIIEKVEGSNIPKKLF